MRLFVIAGTLVLVLPGVAGGQQQDATSNPSIPSQDALGKPKIYESGPDVTAPVLLPLNVPLTPPSTCKNKLDGKVKLSLLVDENGRARNVMFLSPAANDLDKLALMVASADRFTPGTRDGAPVVVGQSLELEIKSCVAEVKDSAGKKSYTVQMRAMPEQRLGRFTEPHGLVPLFPSEAAESQFNDPSVHPVKGAAKVSAPVPLNSVIAQFTPEARRLNVNGICQVSILEVARSLNKSRLMGDANEAPKSWFQSTYCEVAFNAYLLGRCSIIHCFNGSSVEGGGFRYGCSSSDLAIFRSLCWLHCYRSRGNSHQFERKDNRD